MSIDIGTLCAWNAIGSNAPLNAISLAGGNDPIVRKTRIETRDEVSKLSPKPPLHGLFICFVGTPHVRLVGMLQQDPLATLQVRVGGVLAKVSGHLLGAFFRIEHVVDSGDLHLGRPAIWT
ncbi:hypothetical protein ABCW43_16325 [Neorhizobium sp. IRAMC:178]|uniref:hypothetical protein n=1 Tax=Neorhizobium tunisiense TaxID=3144793 RepID=UPI0031F679FB